MELNADFTARVVVHSADIPWVASPMKGVDRRMLDRLGGEVARATTIVRYAPGSAFSAHTHTGGEEFLVLSGTFQDEHGDYPTGTYVRNPPTTSHTPSAADGCVILVKLWQFDIDDRTAVTIRPDDMRPVAGTSGVTMTPLHRDANEVVRVEDWAAGAQINLADHNGAEILVLSGGFTEGGEAFQTDSWLRLPVDATLIATAGPMGAKVWIKTGHLRTAPTAPAV